MPSDKRTRRSPKSLLEASRRLAQRLRDEGLEYAIVDGMAVRLRDLADVQDLAERLDPRVRAEYRKLSTQVAVAETP